MDEGGQVLTELSKHGGHVLLGNRVRCVQVHDGLLQVPDNTCTDMIWGGA